MSKKKECQMKKNFKETSQSILQTKIYFFKMPSPKFYKSDRKILIIEVTLNMHSTLFTFNFLFH